jgi:hypothetical protein
MLEHCLITNVKSIGNFILYPMDNSYIIFSKVVTVSIFFTKITLQNDLPCQHGSGLCRS